MKNWLRKGGYFSRRQLHLLSNLGTAANRFSQEKDLKLNLLLFSGSQL